jgi:endonuclease III
MNTMPRKEPKQHFAADFGLDVMAGDSDMFRWFLLCYLFGKPIRSDTAVDTWRLFIDEKLDTPWAIRDASERKLTHALHRGGYARYEHVTARGLKACMERLINDYEGSLQLMLESSFDEDEFSKRLRQLHGVGPKVAEIFMRETEEIFARRVE